MAEQIALPHEITFPVGIFELLENRNVRDVVAFPRLEEWAWLALKLHGRIVPTEALVFELIQELLLTQNSEIGDVILQISMNISDFLIDYWTWLQFVEEFAFSSPESLVFILSIARPGIFKQQHKSDNLNTDIISILTSSLLCREVCDSPKCSSLLTTLNTYISKCTTFSITPALAHAFDHASADDIARFDSLFPVSPKTFQFLQTVCVTSISRFLGYPPDLGLEFEIGGPLRALAEEDETEAIAQCVLALIVKWALIQMKLGDMTKETLMRIEGELRFRIPRPIGEAMIIKEKLPLTRAQLTRFAQFL